MKIEKMNSPPNPKIKRGLYVILFVSYVCFLISHFLVWGFVTSIFLPLFPQPFTGFDINSGINSLICLNGLFLCSYGVPFVFFFIEKDQTKNKIYWVLNTVFIIICFAVFTYCLTGIFLDWEWAYLSALVFGFYLWLFSALGTLGLLLYFNFKLKTYKKDSNILLTNL